jgi:hypothetical protein
MQLCTGFRDRKLFKVNHLSYSKTDFVLCKLFKKYASIHPVRLGLWDTLNCYVYNIKVSRGFFNLLLHIRVVTYADVLYTRCLIKRHKTTTVALRYLWD